MKTSWSVYVLNLALPNCHTPRWLRKMISDELLILLESPEVKLPPVSTSQSSRQPKRLQSFAEKTLSILITLYTSLARERERARENIKKKRNNYFHQQYFRIDKGNCFYFRDYRDISWLMMFFSYHGYVLCLFVIRGHLGGWHSCTGGHGCAGGCFSQVRFPTNGRILFFNC